jgi:enamine deaminase RidA (YjgF/YER057c/UK114 family)
MIQQRKGLYMSVSGPAHDQDVEMLQALKALLPAPPLPIGSYVAVTRVDNLLYTSGVLPMKDGKVAFVGPLGSWNVPIEAGQQAAELCVLNALSLVNHALDGQLERVKRIVKVTGFVMSLV